MDRFRIEHKSNQEYLKVPVLGSFSSKFLAPDEES